MKTINHLTIATITCIFFLLLYLCIDYIYISSQRNYKIESNALILKFNIEECHQKLGINKDKYDSIIANIKSYFKESHPDTKLVIIQDCSKSKVAYCNVSEVIEITVNLNGNANSPIEFEFDDTGKRIEIEYKTIPISSLDKDVELGMKKYFKKNNGIDFLPALYEKEINFMTGKILYEIEIIENDYISFDSQGNFIPTNENTCEEVMVNDN